MAELPVSLLLGVPTTLDELVQSVSRQRDFTRRYAANPGQHWSMKGGYRESVAEPLAALGADIDRIGGKVIRSAGLTDISTFAHGFGIVILIAHTKGAMVQPSDILEGNPRTLSSALADHDEKELRLLGRSLKNARGLDAGKLARRMNSALLRMQRHILKAAARSKGASRYAIRADQALARARSMLDDAMQDGLVHGHRLELSDGLHGLEALDQAIHPEFSGVLDLTSCVSTMFADELDRRRMGSFRTVMFDQFLPPDIAALAIRQTIATTTVFEPLSYLQARADAIKTVAKAIDDEIKIARKPRRKFH